ncbi:PfkB family carbohydrate kinase, partial [Sutterella parvirubra]
MSDLRELSEIVLSLVPKKRVFIQGSAFVDMIIQIEELPHSGADVEGHYRKTTVGGCSFNVADVLQKLGLPFDALMPVGQGMFADLVEKTFRERGYPVVRVPGAVDNGWCLSLAERSGERTFISMFGIERHMEPEWFDAFDLASYDFIYVSGYQAEGENGAMLLSLLKTRMGPATTVVFDPGPRVHDMPRERIDAFFDLGAMFTVNADEAQALTGEKTPEAAAAAL